MNSSEIVGRMKELIDARNLLFVECSLAEEWERAMAEAADLIQSQQALIEEMREALDTAKATIKAWHGPNAWEIYDRSSPEMVVINSALSKALSQKEQIDG